MLFKVTLSATLTAQPLIAAVSLTPQIEADDLDHAKEKLGEWLTKTGYSIAPGSEPAFEQLDDSGLPPEIAAVNALADENADLKQKLADAGSGETAAKLADLTKQLADVTAERDDARSKASDLLGALDSAKADLANLTNGQAALQKMAQDEAQKVADKDSEIATLKSQLEEALKPAVANPPAAVPVTPAPAAPDPAADASAASATPPADGSTPAT